MANGWGGARPGGGRPRGSKNINKYEWGHVRNLAREKTVEAIETLVDIMKNGRVESARVMAAQVIIEHGWGKAPQAIHLMDLDSAEEAFQAISGEMTAQQAAEQYRATLLNERPGTSTIN